jgi:hypothetical protein
VQGFIRALCRTVRNEEAMKSGGEERERQRKKMGELGKNMRAYVIRECVDLNPNHGQAETQVRIVAISANCLGCWLASGAHLAFTCLQPLTFPSSQKKHYRQRAHANPFSDHALDYPAAPQAITWDSHYPTFVGTGKAPEFADIGCGFGGLLIALAPLFPDTLILGQCWLNLLDPSHFF